MEGRVETLVSIMNLKSIEDWEKFIKESNIKEPSLIINQSEFGNINTNIGKNRIITIKSEVGLSKSRNCAIKNSSGDICILADDDIKYVDNYQNIIEEAFERNKKADIIIFFVESKNKERKNKRIKNGKISFLNLMKVRSYEITFKRESVINSKVIFDTYYGAGTKITRGEEQIFLADCYRKGLKIISYDKYIGYVENKKSTWYKGMDLKYLFCQGAVFKRYSKKLCYLLILQFAIRKHKCYKEKADFFQAIKEMIKGSKERVEEK